MTLAGPDSEVTLKSGPTLIAALRQNTGRYSEALYVLAGLMLVSTAIPAFVSRPTR